MEFLLATVLVVSITRRNVRRRAGFRGGTNLDASAVLVSSAIRGFRLK
ncbi:MAG: hypothetical protein KDA88_20810 [Planctomycetaceae bacterium]|nr:hypothetical protein [Planctomycetaceae bacterium]